MAARPRTVESCAAMARTRLWFTDADGVVYSENQWAEYLKRRRQRWGDFVLVLKVISGLVTFMTLGAALMVPEIDNRSAAFVIGLVALAFFVAVAIIGRNDPRGMPYHTIKSARERPEGWVPLGVGWEDEDD
jgi:hypothetical protein